MPKKYDRKERVRVRTRVPTGGMRQRGCTGVLIYLAFILGISTILAGFSWMAANDVFALNKGEATGVVAIKADDTVGSVATSLKKAGIIQYKNLFLIYAGITNAREKISVGTYELNTTMDYRAIVAALGKSSSSRMTVSVTIPEGYTLEQTFQLMAEKGISSYDGLMKMASGYDYNFSFLKDLPLGSATRLEGYLFPDTYEFYLGEDPKTAINKMLINFDTKVTNEMREKANQMGYSVHEIVNIASMIEKETTGKDQRAIASVIYNRLNNPGTFPYLQIDATVQYALKERKEQLSTEDLKVDSPYNTYRNKGLPAGPIANPGLTAIKAALNPEKTGYYYYALGEDGAHHFFKTHAAQVAFLKEQNNG